MAKPFIANGLCCFWLFTGMIAVVGFLASAGTLAVGLITNDSCGLFNDLFTTQGVNTYNIIIPGNVSVYINTCLNGNGDVASLINLNQFLNLIQMMSYDNLTLANNPASIALGDFSSMNDNKAKVKFPIDYNKVVDSSVAEIFTPAYNLAMLNSYTNNKNSPSYQGNCSTYTLDVWVFAEDFCDNSHPYIPSSDNPTEQIGRPACLVIEEWTTNEVNQRYNPYLTCKGNYTKYIEAYQDSLFEFQYTTDDLYSQINIGLEVVNSTIYDYVYKIIAQNQKIQNYFTSPDQELLLMNAVLDSKTGLYNGLNCSYIHEYSLSLQESMCTNSLENTYEVFIFVFLLSFLMLVLELINLYLSRALLKGEEIY